MKTIDEIMFEENFDLAEMGDEAAVSILFQQDCFDHGKKEFVDWCSESRKFVTRPRSQWPDYEVLREDELDWEGCYERD